ncbi:Glutathione S-transferase GstB [Usitatibacter rugosus]|uniref:Glutathione S-transferase GstB n=1 Tax=Usitatibacter rugosus TaxID=2732067 RepID=A0A6M4GX33_9PROT|nr:glutathione S-transferase [Usitatibacter rugosus]QJR11839.1 Glutathione S-transferase GstB [Usitatibacter rugosus]
MLRILGRLSSVNVQKVVWCADELALEYERVDVGGAFGGNDQADYLAKNPNGLVPVIEDDGFVLYESNAIVRYLAAKHAQASGLWPSELERRADVDRWMEWQSTGFTPAMLVAFWGLCRTPEDKRDAKAIEASLQKGEKFAAVIDAHLAGREHVAGKAFSPADIVVGCATHRWLGLPAKREPRPNLQRWYATLRTRPGAQQVLSQPVA